MNVRQTRIVTSVSRRPSNGLPAVDIATTRGTASPSACGHATTMTVTVRSTATSRLVPSASQAPSVTAPPLARGFPVFRHCPSCSEPAC